MLVSRKSPFGRTSRLFLRAATLLTLPALLLIGTGCSDDDDDNNTPAPTQQNIVQLAQGNTNLSTLVAAVTKTNLAGTLSGTTELTVFAPTNAAFAALPDPFKTATSINAITDANTIAALRGILLYHVIAGDVKAAAITSGARTTQRTATTGINDNTIYLSKNATGVFLNGASQVTTADVDASNGVVHVINKVLLPPTQNIVQIAQANSNLTALVAAVVKTGLATTLSDANANFTVFAPTDAAFAALPDPYKTAASINAITAQADIDFLRNVLLYHAAGARVFSTDLTNNQSVTTAAAAPNNTVTITTTGGAKVKGRSNATASTITAVDILATNGVIHVIDQVLLP
jgi:uncharacterized surface protein with fasciclin (FAS1) repeats